VVRFLGKVALITGAGGAIGAAVAQRLASDGARVVCTDVDEPSAARTARHINDLVGDASASAVTCDVANISACRRVVDTALEHYGRLDVLANVAGVGRFRHSEQLDQDEWNRTLAVNLSGTFFMSQAALGPLLASRGAIVNVASIAGLRATPYNAAYCASKGGVIALTKSLALEFSPRGVRVNCVCPGAVDTPFLAGFTIDDAPLLVQRPSPLGRLITPEEVASGVAYLASDDAATVMGAVLVIDGGATA
jgi:NAD(P)-dependent dehydrogenase (short-subunit alcohol dehydrogenase family)